MSDNSLLMGEETAAPVSDENRIKVVCRVRPPVSRETHGAKGLANRCVSVRPDNRTVMLSSKPQGKSFTFDYAAGEDSTQEELFAEVRARMWGVFPEGEGGASKQRLCVVKGYSSSFLSVRLFAPRLPGHSTIICSRCLYVVRCSTPAIAWKTEWYVRVCVCLRV